MPRFTVSITDEQDAWIERQAEERDRSKSQIIRQLIDAQREDQASFTDPVNPDRPTLVSDGELPAPLKEQFESIIDRLDGIERELSEERGGISEGRSPSKDAVVDSAASARDDLGESVEDRAAPVSGSDPSPAEASDDVETASRVGDLIIAPSTENERSAADEADGTGWSEPEDTRTEETESGSTEESDASDSRAGDSNSTATSSTRRPELGPTGEWPTDVGDKIKSDSDDRTETTRGSDSQSSSSERKTGSSSGGQVTVSKRSAGTEDGEPTDTGGVDPSAVEELVEERVADETLADSVFSCWNELRKRGTADERQFKAVFDEQGSYESPVTWWEDVREHLETLPGVNRPPENGRYYRYSYTEDLDEA